MKLISKKRIDFNHKVYDFQTEKNHNYYVSKNDVLVHNSGKGFAIKNFLDSASFKKRDVDEMKKQIQTLNKLGKTSIDTIIKKYGRNIKPKDLDKIKKVQEDGYTLQKLDLKIPDHVYVLHTLVKAMGIKDSSLEKLLVGKNNPKTLPNILFDITAKDVTDITKVTPMLRKAGYDPKNIHLTWVLTNYVTALENNRGRDRMVPEDILLKTHQGAANTVWGLVTKAMPRGLNGRVDVILNNRENTVFLKTPSGKDVERVQKDVGTDVSVDKTGKRKTTRTVKDTKVKFPSDFVTLPLKKAGGGIFPEKVWRKKLYGWVKDNAPDEITANMTESVNENISVSDERPFGKKGIIIMLDRNGKKVSAIFKNKKNADKFNRNKPEDIKKLLDLANRTKFPKAVDESINEETPEESLVGLREMAMGDLERASDYSKMILNRMKSGEELESWMYSQITLAVDQLNSVHDSMDGNDGVVE